MEINLNKIQSIDNSMKVATIKPEQVQQNTKENKVQKLYKQMDETTQESNFSEKDMLETLNKMLAPKDQRVQRSVHEKTKAMMYQIIDNSTDEIIMEYPPKKIQDMVAKLIELSGIFVDEKI